ncbi:MAG: DivIVA domain-containing protein [Gomphosphaeria aponina SAG 52.96 = DSM 107014]|uniref:DivIVA domain-containing protein n=1 Tax=Gomphosphaeria aponina SAG 52.96 = DSM 107014 TaxID=1521640 RepID=A0A941GPA4_9CHRO|nr:DivIVA domain-containing protein [Gomphosphaeria aponina SAG 52.96 = DSM 107014]
MLNENFENDYEAEEPNRTDTPPQGFDLEAELNFLEELICSSFRIPLTGLTLVDEDQLLNQLDLVRDNLPPALEKAEDIIRQQKEILQEAADIAEQIIQEAEQKADQIKNQTGIIQQAEREAYQIRHQLNRDCETIQQQTLAEVEQLRQRAIAECEEMRNGADNYADAVLSRIETQLGEMMRVIQNGRQQIYQNSKSR